MQSTLIELRKIGKNFPGVRALSEIDFILRSGEIVSLVGTNGAGKSTLSHIIAGIYQQSEGDIILDGKRIDNMNTGIAKSLGIGMVHQEPTLVPNMTVMANMFLNKEKTRNSLFLNNEDMKNDCSKILDFLGFDISPVRRVEELSLVEREIVELAKAMLLRPKILILDEITAPLNKKEVEHIFEVIRELKSRGLGILFIGHRIKEILTISDRIVVLRDGKKVGELDNKAALSERLVIELMLGQSTAVEEHKDSHFGNEYEKNEIILKTVNLSSQNFKNINIEIKRGEVLGIAGLKGSGITELMKALYGVVKVTSGGIILKGKEVQVKNTTYAINNGIGFITNDRQKEGLALILDVTENITISSLEKFRNVFKVLDRREMKRAAKSFVNMLEIKTPSLGRAMQFLSGGNQQKAVIAKWLLKDSEILLIDEPTRGVDIKAKGEIYKLIGDEKRRGKAIIVTSPEVHELINMCDRIVILVSGLIISEIRRNTERFNEKYILEMIHMSH